MSLQEKLMFTSFELFMRYGVKSVSMDDIATKLGISKKTIYNFIDNKKELIHKVIKAHLEKEEDDINAIVKNSKDAIDAMVSIAKHVLQFLRKMKPSLIYDLKKYYGESWLLVENRHYSFIYGIIRDNLLRGVKEGFYKNEINPDIIAKLYVLMARSVADEEHFPLEVFTRSELFEELIRYHMQAIVSEKGREYLCSISIN